MESFGIYLKENKNYESASRRARKQPWNHRRSTLLLRSPCDEKPLTRQHAHLVKFRNPTGLNDSERNIVQGWVIATASARLAAADIRSGLTVTLAVCGNMAHFAALTCL